MNEIKKIQPEKRLIEESAVSWRWMAGLLLFAVCTTVRAQDQDITEKNIVFIDYPGFPEGHSTWNDIGYNAKYNTVYAGVTNHKDKIAFYEYDASKKSIKLEGLVADMGHLRSFQWQGKVHTKMIAGPDGAMYFGTDGGESRQEYLMNHPHGYGGGFFMKWDPQKKELTNLGMSMQYESIKDVDIDPETGKIYAISYPQVHFLLYDPATNDFQDLGRLGSTHVPRVIFTDEWGNCYYVDWRQRLVKYEKSLKKLVFARESLPAFPGTPGSKIVTGLTGYAKDPANGTIYLVTYGAKLVAFHPQKNGIGKVEDLGGLFDTGEKEPWRPFAPNLNLGNNGKLYYFVGGHGNYMKDHKSIFVEFDPATRKRRILFDYDLTEVTEVTGCDTKDKDGNLYFLGRHDAKKGSNNGQEGSTAFLIKFNPEKEVRK